MIELSARSAFSFSLQEDPRAWFLREGDRGQASVPVKPLPFVIGRSLDCDLILPHSAELSRTTSRWHCHLFEEDGSVLVADGSHAAVPETGKRKPSITGTFVNGALLDKPHALKKGDVLAVGPWEFAVREQRETSVDIDGLLRRIGAESPRTIDERDPALAKGFGQLHELYAQLNETFDSDESLLTIMRFAMSKIKAAQVAAILVDAPGGAPTVRIAWQREAGRILDFHFSSGLVKGLPVERAFLLKSNIQEDITKSQVEQRISSGLVVPLRGNRGRLGLLYMDNRNHGISFTEDDLYLANALASVTSLQLALERQAFLVNVELNMRQYFGPQVARLIAEESKKGRPVSLGVRECEATILFFDLQAFSQYCRGKTPQEIGALLNPYFELAAEAIQRHGGHVDKFIGDGVLGVFGAQPIQPVNSRDANHAACAVRAAREMINGWSARKPPVHVRAGLNTGPVIIGNIGYPGRMEYSVLGDTVNLASRLEHLAKADSVAMSESTFRLALNECEAVSDGEVEVKGFGRIKVWQFSV